MSAADKPLPILDSLSAEWYRAARDGVLLIQRSRSTGWHQFYPRQHALGTLQPDLDWVPASGRGALHTFTVVHRTANPEFAGDCPYVLAIVELEEGPRVTSHVVDVPHDQLRCGMPLRVVFRAASDDVVLPYFTAGGTS